MKWCFYTHPKLTSEKWQPNKKIEEKITKKKVTDKKKDDDKSKRKENKFKPNIIIIHYHHAFNSALNMNALSEVLKRITDLMSFIKTLINSKITVNKTTTLFSF